MNPHPSHTTDYSERERQRLLYLQRISRFEGNGIPDRREHSAAPKRGTSKLAKLANLD